MTTLGPRSRRVVLIEDHSLFAEALETALVMEGFDPHRLAVGAGTTRAQLLSQALDLSPGMLLLDLDLGAFGNGLPLIEPLTGAGIRVVVVTASNDRARWGEAYAAGARRVVSKGAPLTSVITTIRRSVEGLSITPELERQELIAEWRRQLAEEEDERARFAELTRREGEVLGLLMDGRQVAEIAQACFVSESTVRTQVKAILAKLRVSSQLAAVGLAHRTGWRPPLVHQRW
jgi:DNA-binding NarL/FixJ family response regulator